VPTTSTVLEPEPETMTDLETIEAGVAALYSGDADRAVELFELDGLFPDSAGDNDEWIRDEVAYQTAIGGRMTVDCNERSGEPGVFNCTRRYHNTLTDAIGYGDLPFDTLWVVVKDGVIGDFGDFPSQDEEANGPLGAFLREVGESPTNSDSLCEFGSPFTRARSPSRNVRLTFECVDFVLDHLDEWAAWYETNN